MATSRGRPGTHGPREQYASGPRNAVQLWTLWTIVERRFGAIRSTFMGRKSRPAFDLKSFLGSVGAARKIAEFRPKERIFTQGDPANTVLYIEEGAVRLSV